MNMQVEDIIIIGAGPAGLAAAIQLKRYGIQSLLFERAALGGLLRNANLVENYPGFPRGVTGPGLVKLFARQAYNMGVVLTHEDVTTITHDQELFQVSTGQNSYCSRVAVIATGTKPVRIADQLIPEELQDRIFYEVYDLLREEGKCLVIIGSGDVAFDYALNLGKKNRVIILNRGEESKCLPLLWERAQKIETISYKNSAVVQKVTKYSKSGMLVDCQTPAGELQFHADYLLVAIGREANLDCLSDALMQQTSMLEKQSLLYVIGDVKNGIFRQTAIAVGEGVLAAMRIYRYLKAIP